MNAASVVIEDSLRMAERVMHFENISIEKDFDPIPELEINTNNLQQVFINLLSNAVQSMPDGGSLSLSCKVDDSYARITIRYTGIGIENKKSGQTLRSFLHY